jgi:hypothetical protein
MTSCAECGQPVRSRDALWLLPSWPNPWTAQGPVPFHRACPERAT